MLGILEGDNTKKHVGYPLFILISHSCNYQYMTCKDSPGTGTRDHGLTAHVTNGVPAIAASVPSSLRHCTAVWILNMISISILELSWTDSSECVLARTSTPFFTWELCECFTSIYSNAKTVRQAFYTVIGIILLDEISCSACILSCPVFCIWRSPVSDTWERLKKLWGEQLAHQREKFCAGLVNWLTRVFWCTESVFYFQCLKMHW